MSVLCLFFLKKRLRKRAIHFYGFNEISNSKALIIRKAFVLRRKLFIEIWNLTIQRIYDINDSYLELW